MKRMKKGWDYDRYPPHQGNPTDSHVSGFLTGIPRRAGGDAMNSILALILLVLGYLFFMWIFSLFPPETRKWIVDFIKI